MKKHAPYTEGSSTIEPPAMGERRARWGLGYQDKAATIRILDILREELRARTSSLQGVSFADLEAGRVDDFVLVWDACVQGSSLKWSEDAASINWGELVGANGLLKELADGYIRLSKNWADKKIYVQLQSNRPPATVRHPNQLIKSFSVAEFLQNHWAKGPRKDDSDDVAAAWAKFKEHVGMGDDDFSHFVAACTFALGVPEPSVAGPDTLDLRHFRKQFDELHKEIAVWLTNHPTENFVPREYLLRAIGHRGPESGLLQRFPEPRIPYQKNASSAKRLMDLVESTHGGYIAVTGSAGIGKSTLVQDALSQSPFFVPYYAYLPDGEGNPRERGEALTFFQDVIQRLDSFFVHRSSIGISDVREGKEALREMMKKANELFKSKGLKTIVLIDGLDHVIREVGLHEPIQNELFPPTEVPDGFLFILSSQPQALSPHAMERHIASSVVEGSDRRIEVDGLDRTELHEIIAKAADGISSSDRDILSDACRGNPLVLTYLLNSLSHGNTVAGAVQATVDYKGNIETYYRSALSVPLYDPNTRRLLGLLSRAVPNVPIHWLQSWPEVAQIEQLYQSTLAPFVRDEEGNLRFIHNSLIAFLRDETRSRLPGADLERDEQEFHSTLADRCGHRPCSDPLGRAKIFHLHRAGRDNELLALMSSPWLRAAVEDFLPYEEVQALILSGLGAAWKSGKYGEVLRFILLRHELQQRMGRIEPDDLAARLLTIGRISLAIGQIRESGRMLVSDKAALRFAKQLWNFARREKRDDLREVSRNIYRQAKPVGYLHHGGPIEPFRDQTAHDALRAWADAAPLFDDVDLVKNQIKQLQFTGLRQGEARPSVLKADLLLRALQTTLTLDENPERCNSLLLTLREMFEPSMEFSGLLDVYERYRSPELRKRLDKLAETIKLIPDTWLRFAKMLRDSGDPEHARRITAFLQHKRFDYFNQRAETELSDVGFTVELRCMQELFGTGEGILQPVTNSREEAMARVEAAARSIGTLLAKVIAGEQVSHLRETFRAVLLFHNRPVTGHDVDWHENYAVRQYKPDIYGQLLRVAARIGKPALTVLHEEFLYVIESPAGNQFTPDDRRQFALAFFNGGVCDRAGASSLGLSSDTDTKDDDPGLRESACLSLAVFFHAIGDETACAGWLRRAGKVTAGTGNHKDYHMTQLATWLMESIGASLDETKLVVINKFSKSIEVAGGAGGSSAATELLQHVTGIDPQRAISLSIDLIDRDLLNLSDVLEAIVIGGARAGAAPALLSAIYTELLSLLHPESTPEAAVATQQRFPINERLAAANSLMMSVRTNSLPSHRISVGRALQDALRKDALGEIKLTEGLKAGQDDSSRGSSLYKLPNGELRTIGQVSEILSETDQKINWDPNPSENAGFDWLRAIQKSCVKDAAHLEEIVSTIAVPDYKNVDLLLWKARWYLKFGNRTAARAVATEASEKAQRSSWFTSWDGAQLRSVFGVLSQLDHGDSMQIALARFGDDLASGRLYNVYLLGEIVEIFRFFGLKWPPETLNAIADYLDGILSASRHAADFHSLTSSSTAATIESAICRFVVRLLSFPVVDVGVAARRTLAKYAREDGTGLSELVKGDPVWDDVQFEHLLAAIQIGLRERPGGPLRHVESYLLNLNQHQSIAVRAIARRICTERGLQWQEVRNLPARTVIVVPGKTNPKINFLQVQNLVASDADIALNLHPMVTKTLEGYGNDPDELRSEFRRIYGEVDTNYLWRDDRYLALWRKLVLARFWLNPRALVGRESALRLFGGRVLRGQGPIRAETSYDFLYPIYDPVLELVEPIERPAELRAMEWNSRTKDSEQWLAGASAADWSYYPQSVGTLHVLGERTMFIRPDWEWPREERYRGLFVGTDGDELDRDSLASGHELTYDDYLQGNAQTPEQLVIWNSERQLVGSPYRWIALNSSLAANLNWIPSGRPFEWTDKDGQLMVKSVFWRDGWIGLEPPRFESLGEGWLVLATGAALERIAQQRPEARYHLWVERHSHGDKTYSGSWHLESAISQTR